MAAGCSVLSTPVALMKDCGTGAPNMPGCGIGKAGEVHDDV